MVKHGQFSVRLIRAETGASYKEHGAPGGKDIYAEVEPDDEFYLQLRSEAPEVVYVDLAVDGMLIQKGHRAHPGRTSRVGVIRADSIAGERRTTEVALRFARAQVHDGLMKNTACEYWTGEVKATFYGNPNYRIPPEASPKPDGTAETKIPATIQVPALAVAAAPVASTIIYAAPENTYIQNPSLATSDVGYVAGATNENQKKGVKGAEGTTALRTHTFRWNSKPSTSKTPKNRYEQSTSIKFENAPKVKDPEKLGSITLKYCSTVGLIHAGILDKPPNWDMERLKQTCSKRTREDHARILSEIKIQKFELNSERINGQGEKVVEKTEVEVLDLTESDMVEH